MGVMNVMKLLKKKLKPLIRRIHGSERHAGKMPIRFRGTAKIQREIVRLRGQLDQAVRREAFEEAAMIRDRINALENSMEVSNELKAQTKDS